MPRSAVEVRRATGHDVDLLHRLAQRAQYESGTPTRGDAGPQRARALKALDRADVTVFLAVAGEEPVGALTLRFGELLPLTGSDAVHVEQLFVDPDWRRKGVARQLLAAAATSAEHYGAAEIVCATPAGARNASRFLTRLGFAPFVVQRAVTVGALRRHLGAASGSSRRKAADIVLAQRRRQAQARARTSPGAAAAPVMMKGRPAGGT